MIQVQGNSFSRSYCRLGFLAAFCLSFLLGCSSTPSPQSLQRSFSTSPVGSSPPPIAPASAPEGFGNRANHDELPQIQSPAGKYILGSGDAVTVTVWGHPELSGKRVIGPDGEIQLPFVGSFRVAGLDADRASSKITSALREDYLNTAASVTVDSYNSNQVIVLGHVAHQGVLTFAGEPKLLEALAMAGAAPGKDDTAAMPVRCAVIRGRDSIMWIDLRPLMKGQDVSLNIPLQRNDLVYVPDPDAELVYVMGQVKNPGPYPLTANMSFLEALARAGGPNDSAQQGKIVLARKNSEQVIDLESFVQKGSSSNSQLEAGDIVYVPKSGVAKVGYVLQQLNPLTTLAFFGTLL
jgi:polysaccharide export outer membrane protein